MEGDRSKIWRECHAAVFGVAALVFWLAPFFVSGWTGRYWRWLPQDLSFQHTAAGLFTHRTPVWWDHHIEGERLDGTRFELPENVLFPTGAFGYRSKFDRIMNESVRSRIVKQIRLRLAEHVFKRWAELGLEPKHLKAVRFVRSTWKAGTHEMANPPGHWNSPPINELPGTHKVLLAGYHHTGSRVRPFWQEGDPMPKAPALIPPLPDKAPKRKLAP